MCPNAWAENIGGAQWAQGGPITAGPLKESPSARVACPTTMRTAISSAASIRYGRVAGLEVRYTKGNSIVIFQAELPLDLRPREL